ncbi:hypothetical protein BDY19DRAFT_900274 [Irpex rosettiformis]|uniref:Uncharacterized protein n=1 Tax=Irpex rosettiformis TaxID=378272 RepID=A0ACB8TNA9_9APHY|nr:hypothetical protein BDY19DRAFT_900274 [Irpex rosettiformis]
MAHIGSVFLGDVQRQRILSTSTPPSSPPPAGPSPTHTQAFPDFLAEVPQEEADDDSTANSTPPKVTPEVAFELRTRLLESIVIGPQSNVRGTRTTPLTKDIEDVQKKLQAVVQSSGSDSLRWFVDNYDQYQKYLTPAFALSGIIPTSTPLYENMSPNELEAFLTEMGPDIRAADRDLREIEMLESKDVTAAGKLPEYQKLQPRLEQLLQESEENRRKHDELEQRIAKVMNQYATTTDKLSELFVAWDDTLYDAEGQVAKLHRNHEERQKLGLE